MEAGFEAAPGSAAAPAQLNALPVAAQWVVSAILFVVMVAWLILGNVATGSVGRDDQDCPLDSWLVPLLAMLLAYVTGYGFFGLPAKSALGDVAPIIVASILAALFA